VGARGRTRQKNRPGCTGPACAVSGTRFPRSRGFGSPPWGAGRLYRPLASHSICCTPDPPALGVQPHTGSCRIAVGLHHLPTDDPRVPNLSQIFHSLSTGASKFSSAALPTRHSSAAHAPWFRACSRPCVLVQVRGGKGGPHLCARWEGCGARPAGRYPCGWQRHGRAAHDRGRRRERPPPPGPARRSSWRARPRAPAQRPGR
jgi:hypothetical protein